MFLGSIVILLCSYGYSVSTCCMALTRGKAAKASTSSITEESTPSVMEQGQFALSLIEAFKDPSVLENLKQATKPDYDAIADKVASKLGAVINKLQKAVETKDRQITELQTRVDRLEAKLDDQEQYSRRTSVRISGIPEAPQEDVNQKVSELFSAVNLSPVINRVHRVGTPVDNSSTPRAILCQFTSYPDKKTVMQKRKAILEAHSGIYVNEDLTRLRSKMLFLARQKKRANIISDAWSVDGRIVIKDIRNKIHYVTRPHELDTWPSSPSAPAAPAAPATGTTPSTPTAP